MKRSASSATAQPHLLRWWVILAHLSAAAWVCLPLPAGEPFAPTDIPLPEHPRPDFQRADWLNLNGPWQFAFGQEQTGEKAHWSDGQTALPGSIKVPFSWGSKLSGVEDHGDIGWYRRTIQVPESWRGKRVFVVVGACDWQTQGWLDGQAVGTNRGGYTPFEFELTPNVKWGQDQALVLRVDDTPHPFKLEGKQGYGQARGIWQTVYLEARAPLHIASIHFTPDIDQGQVLVTAQLSDPAPENTRLRVTAKGPAGPLEASANVASGALEVSFRMPVPSPRLWSLDDPFLYEAEATLSNGRAEDHVATYFGMRHIGVAKLPGMGFPYITLNHRPIYLQITLDQAYHPEGFYTFPSDAFMRDEILRSRRIGLNAIRVHVKIEMPRKLYWADRLGLLVMADVPNSWGQPDGEMRQEAETAMRGMIRRDYNHPAIFSWVVFNETWGLFTDRKYLPNTQQWVDSMYRLAKSLDATRLVEDNSPCNNDHVATDINSWHSYLPGYAWREHLDQVTRDTAPGSHWNYIGGRVQGDQPLLNSECGNVWGYEGSSGDVDWSWDYHIMMNEFRRHPKVCGWLYTEHHDVINEWNGYYRFDRTEKDTGLGDLVAGMSLKDLHDPFYLATGGDLCEDVAPGQSVEVPLWASFLTDKAPATDLHIRFGLYGWDTLGRREIYSTGTQSVPFQPWLSRALTPLKVKMPNTRGVAVLGLVLETESGAVLHRNFSTFRIGKGDAPREETLASKSGQVRVIRFAPKSFRQAQWSEKQWEVLDGLKVNGAGHGFFEYRLPWPAGLDPAKVSGGTFVMEASAKRLMGKDRRGSARQEGDFMRGKGTFDPSLNPNSYPMTDTRSFPSEVRVRVAGESVGVYDLPNDPADHRGILSWHAQLRDKHLREAGSYGYLVSAPITSELLRHAAESKEIIIRLEVDEGLSGGLAIYGEHFGRYPLDPTLVLNLK